MQYIFFCSLRSVKPNYFLNIYKLQKTQKPVFFLIKKKTNYGCLRAFRPFDHNECYIDYQ